MKSHHRSVFEIDDSETDLGERLVEALRSAPELVQADIAVRGVDVERRGGKTIVTVSSTFDSAGRPEIRPRAHRPYVELCLEPILAHVAPARPLDPHT